MICVVCVLLTFQRMQQSMQPYSAEIHNQVTAYRQQPAALVSAPDCVACVCVCVCVCVCGREREGGFYGSIECDGVDRGVSLSCRDPEADSQSVRQSEIKSELAECVRACVCVCVCVSSPCPQSR